MGVHKLYISEVNRIKNSMETARKRRLGCLSSREVIMLLVVGVTVSTIQQRREREGGRYTELTIM